MRLPRDSVGVPVAASLRPSSSSPSLSSCKLVGNKENVQPPEGSGGGGSSSSSESSTAANLLWLLDFRLDNLLPNDGNIADKMAHVQVNKETGDSVAANSGSSGGSAGRSGGSGASPPAVKPPYTYTELIEQALSEKGPLTVAEIYRWISERFPYFKANDDRWKNSVRHNLSISPHFRKSVKARTGTGHLWTLALPPSARTIAANLAQKAKENNVQSEEVQDEVARACMELLRAEGSPAVQTTEYEPQQQDGRNSPLTFERAAELMLAESGNGNCEGRVHVEFLARPLQLLAHMENGSCSPEFLNPIPRDELMEESGLFSIEDPFNSEMEDPHQNNQCQIQVVTDDNQMQTEEVNFDAFPHAVNDATSMLFGDDYPLSYSYEIL
ncbi:protein fork head-like [Daphnia carinata]|uniref:protein fork head-like n=1 Tax=Daphnia carinata TaxID=120202 RepID=UPI00257BC25B|nr:protein fork head-like [Daphnia carinata]